MKRRDRIAAVIAALVVAGNLVALTLGAPHRHTTTGAGTSRARTHARVEVRVPQIRVSVRPPERLRDRSSLPTGPPPGTKSVKEALRRAARFAELYAHYRNQPLDRAGVRELRGLASLQLAGTLIAQPPLGGGGKSPHLRVATTPRLALVSARAAIAETTLVAGSHHHRLRCVLKPKGGGWVIVGFRYGSATVVGA